VTIKTNKSVSDNKRKKIEIKNILVPIDGSDYSLNAAEYAIRIARNEKAQLFCIHIVTPGIPYGYATPASTESRNHDEAIKRKIESWFDDVRNMAKEEDIHDIKTEIFIDVKSIIQSILEYASRKNIDLMVLGTKGRTGLKKFLVGSVAAGVVQHAHCPVLVVR
jgi:nucleotide-binding universal stress UspA family protein